MKCTFFFAATFLVVALSGVSGCGLNKLSDVHYRESQSKSVSYERTVLKQAAPCGGWAVPAIEDLGWGGWGGLGPWGGWNNLGSWGGWGWGGPGWGGLGWGGLGWGGLGWGGLGWGGVGCRRRPYWNDNCVCW